MTIRMISLFIGMIVATIYMDIQGYTKTEGILVLILVVLALIYSNMGGKSNDN